MQKTRAQRREEQVQKYATLIDIFLNHPEIMEPYLQNIPHKFMMIMENIRAKLADGKHPADIDKYFEIIVSYNPGVTYETLMMQAYPTLALAFAEGRNPGAEGRNPGAEGRNPGGEFFFEPEPVIYQPAPAPAPAFMPDAFLLVDENIYAVIVPARVSPGQHIACKIKNMWVMLICPPNARPNSTVIFKRNNDPDTSVVGYDTGMIIRMLAVEDVLSGKIMNHIFVPGY